MQSSKEEFQKWLAEVDQILLRVCGRTHRQLPDFPSWDTFDDYGASPAEGAEICLELADAPEQLVHAVGGLTMPSDIVQCQCGDYLCDELCTFRGPIEETVVVEVMPEYLRASHQSAGNWGVYPYNGSRRLRVHHECAEVLCEGDEYNHVVVDEMSGAMGRPTKNSGG